MLSEHGVGKSLFKEISYIISSKETEDFFKFKGQVTDFLTWKTKMMDHLARSTCKYRTIVEAISKRKQIISKQELLATEIDGFNGWEIAVMLSGFTLR